MPARIGGQPDALQPDALHARASAGGHQEAIPAQLDPSLQLDHIVRTVAARRGRVGAGVQLDPLGAEHLAHGLAECGGLLPEQAVTALDDGHGRAEAADGLGHLHAHRPPAQDQKPLRHLPQAGGLAVRPDALELPQARHGRNERTRAVGQDHVLGAQLPVAHGHAAGPRQAALAAHQVDALALGPCRLARVVIARHLEVAPRERRAHVQVAAGGLRRSRRLAGGLERLARPQERLRRDAGPVRALASEQLPFDDRHLRASIGESRRRSARPGSLHRG